MKPWVCQPLLPFDDLADIIIVDVFEAEKLASEADWVFSIWNRGGPDDWKPPAWVAEHPNARLFEFNDTVEDDGPSEEHVRQILEVAPYLGGRVLVHCMMGVSRSAATVLAILACRLGPGREYDAVKAMLLSRQRTAERGWRHGGVSPNRRLVRFADGLLRRRGVLVEALNDTLMG